MLILEGGAGGTEDASSFPYTVHADATLMGKQVEKKRTKNELEYSFPHGCLLRLSSDASDPDAERQVTEKAFRKATVTVRISEDHVLFKK